MGLVRTAILLAVLAVALAACGGGGARSAPSVRCPAAGLRTVEGGALAVPRAARAGATPLLLVVVPGGRGDPDDDLGVRAAALRAGLAVLYATSDDGFWSLNHAQGDADVVAARGLVERTLATGCFDRRRVSATGVSNGAGFATRMACELPSTFAAVIPVSAGFRALDPCRPSARTSLLALHGSADTIVPFDGKKPERKGSVPRFAARWAARLGCSGGPRTTHPAARVERVRWAGCPAGLSVGYVRLSGSTHGWFGASLPGFPQRNPSGFRATPEVVRAAVGARRG